MIEELIARWGGEAIPHCAGRFVLTAAPPELSPEELVGPAVPLHEFRVAAARDPVVVAQLPDGGLISYRRAAQRFLHTVNTPDGFARKLSQLGIHLAS